MSPQPAALSQITVMSVHPPLARVARPDTPLHPEFVRLLLQIRVPSPLQLTKLPSVLPAVNPAPALPTALLVRSDTPFLEVSVEGVQAAVSSVATMWPPHQICALSVHLALSLMQEHVLVVQTLSVKLARIPPSVSPANQATSQ